MSGPRPGESGGAGRGFDTIADENPRVQRATWRLQRLGWALLALFLLAGALGLLGGSGPLARMQIDDDAAGLTLTYPRTTRYLSPTRLRVEMRDASDRTLQLAVARRWVEHFVPYSIDPEPRAQRIRGEQVIYEFDVEQGEIVVDFSGRLDAVGVLHGEVQRGERPPVAFRTWVLP